MIEKDLWKLFECTGSIEIYMTYAWFKKGPEAIDYSSDMDESLLKNEAR